MKPLVLKAILGAVLLCLAVPAARAQSSSRVEAVGNISGTVLDSYGRPVADASVTIQTSDGLHPHATHTDSTGRFQFDRWATGQYDLRAYHKGLYSSWDQRVVIRSKKTTEVTLRLEAE